MKDINIDEVVDALQQRVAERRASGDYPPGLEQQLESEFDLVMSAIHRPEVDTSEAITRIEAVGLATRAIGAPPSIGSRVPGGSALHAATGRLVRRHTSQLADEVRQLGVDTGAALDSLRQVLDRQRSADERQLTEVIGSLHDRVAILDHLANAIIDLENRVLRLEERPQRS